MPVSQVSVPDKAEEEVRMPAFPLVAGCVPILRRIAGAGHLLENAVDSDLIMGRIYHRLRNADWISDMTAFRGRRGVASARRAG
jgi:hypothetical protein